MMKDNECVKNVRDSATMHPDHNQVLYVCPCTTSLSDPTVKLLMVFLSVFFYSSHSTEENVTPQMAFINHIPDQVPGLSHLKVVNDNVLKPGLSVVQTAKSYIDTMKKDKQSENATHTIPIDTISKNDRKSTHYDPIDHEFTDNASAERQRVHELLNPRAVNPPFSKCLPRRPGQKQPINRWKASFFGVLLLAVAAVIPLSIIAAKPCSPDCDPKRSGQQSAITVTATAVSTDFSLVSVTSVRVSTKTVGTTSVSVVTSLVTDADKATATGIGSDKEEASP